MSTIKKNSVEESYSCSKDYDSLVELIKSGKKIICFIDSQLEKSELMYRQRLICEDLDRFDSLYLAFNENKSSKVFIEFCERANLTFIPV